MAKKKLETFFQDFKLGDMVEKVAKPIAKAIDAVAGTDLENCEECKQRKEKLNNITKSKPKKRATKKVVNKLSKEETELLLEFVEDRMSYVSHNIQLRLLALIEREEGWRYEPTSCGKCFMGQPAEKLRDIARKNGLIE